MNSSVIRFKQLLHEENEHHVHLFIDYLCLHTKLKSYDLQYHYKNFKSSDMDECISEALPTTCTYVFTKGSKSGQSCKAQCVADSTFCRKHGKTKQSKAAPNKTISKETFEKDFLALIDEELEQGTDYDDLEVGADEDED